GAICNDTSYAVAHAHAGRLKERLMQLCDRISDSRFLRDVIAIGGVTRNLPAATLQTLAAEVYSVEQDFTELERILLANASLTDRIEGTGVLSPETARDHAAVGVVGRSRPMMNCESMSPAIARAMCGRACASARTRSMNRLG